MCNRIVYNGIVLENLSANRHAYYVSCGAKPACKCRKATPVEETVQVEEATVSETPETQE